MARKKRISGDGFDDGKPYSQARVDAVTQACVQALRSRKEEIPFNPAAILSQYRKTSRKRMKKLAKAVRKMPAY